ncbi:MAG: hypothetical protein ACLTY5_05710 [Angelakisella sp.]
MWRDPEHYRCPDWLREEVTKVSHRDYTTGFPVWAAGGRTML